MRVLLERWMADPNATCQSSRRSPRARSGTPARAHPWKPKLRVPDIYESRENQLAFAANLIHFLHPTIAPPFDAAIVKGYNALTIARRRQNP